jgi:hypothetical protein
LRYASPVRQRSECFFYLLLLLSTRVLPPRYATGYLQCVYLL